MTHIQVSTDGSTSSVFHRLRSFGVKAQNQGLLLSAGQNRTGEGEQHDIKHDMGNPGFSPRSESPSSSEPFGPREIGLTQLIVSNFPFRTVRRGD